MASRKLPQRWAVIGDKAIAYIVQRNGRRHKVTVSTEDLPRVDVWRWHLCGKGAAWSSQIEPGTVVSMHSVIVGRKGVDHKNRNKLDNRRQNLRVCLHSQNLKNKSPNRNARVRLKGVFKRRNSKTNPYIAKITSDGVTHRIGKFNNPEDAARAYDEMALKLHGEYALTNKMLGLL